MNNNDYLKVTTNYQEYNDIFIQKLITINSNDQYIKWINTFNWKNNKPITPNKYILT